MRSGATCGSSILRYFDCKYCSGDRPSGSTTVAANQTCFLQIAFAHENRWRIPIQIQIQSMFIISHNIYMQQLLHNHIRPMPFTVYIKYPIQSAIIIRVTLPPPGQPQSWSHESIKYYQFKLEQIKAMGGCIHCGDRCIFKKHKYKASMMWHNIW